MLIKDLEETTKNNILKQIKYETLHKNRISTEIFVDTIATKELTNRLCYGTSKIISGYIQFAAIDPYGFLLISDIQVTKN